MSETVTKTRKPRARQKDVVIGGIEEHLLIIEKRANSDGYTIDPSLTRLKELMDELKRSLNGKETEE